MDWSRTARIDPAPHAPQRFSDALSVIEGVRASMSSSTPDGHVYALIEGPQSVDPAELSARVPGRWYDEVIVVLAIEPRPADALPHLLQRLTSAGAPSGVIEARIEQSALVLEFSPRTSPLVVISLIDAELRRWNGTRNASLVAPLSASAWALLAAHGLQAPQIAPDRILESLLEAAHVE